jgi:hypothetical protein
MIDANDGNIPEQSERLGQGKAYCETTCQPRTASYGNSRYGVSETSLFFRLVKQDEKVGKVLANRNVGHDATILYVSGYLTVYPLADNSLIRRKEGKSGFVTRTLDAQNHGFPSSAS